MTDDAHEKEDIMVLFVRVLHLHPYMLTAMRLNEEGAPMLDLDFMKAKLQIKYGAGERDDG